MKARRKQFGTRAVLAIVLLAFAVSLLFIVYESEHICVGDDCPVCLAISACLDVLKTLGKGAALFFLSLVISPFSFRFGPFFYENPRQNTPISLKVKLTD